MEHVFITFLATSLKNMPMPTEVFKRTVWEVPLGDVFEGGHNKGLKHGKGKLTCTDGAIFEGNGFMVRWMVV